MAGGQGGIPQAPPPPPMAPPPPLGALLPDVPPMVGNQGPRNPPPGIPQPMPGGQQPFWPQFFPPVYQGWVLRKAIPEPGQKYNWDRVQLTEFPVPPADLTSKSREQRWKKSVSTVYDNLRTDTQRIHIDSLVREANQREPNPFAEWRLANIEVRYRELRRGWSKATETSQIRVILKKCPRGEAGMRRGEPFTEIRDVNEPLSMAQPLMGPQPQLGLAGAPPPPMGGPPGVMPPFPMNGPPGALGGGVQMQHGGKGQGKKNKHGGKDQRRSRSRSRSRSSSRRGSKNRRNSSSSKLEAKVSKMLNRMRVDDRSSDSSTSDSDSDSDDSIVAIERRSHKSNKRHSRSRSRGAKRGHSRSRTPFYPPPFGSSPRGYPPSVMSGGLPGARGRSRTREEFERGKINGRKFSRERIVREFNSSESEGWEDIGSSASGSRSSHWSSPASSIGSGRRYVNVYRDRERSLSRSRRGSFRDRSSSRPRYFDSRKPPPYPAPILKRTSSSDTDDSFTSRRTSTSKEVHHHYHGAQNSTPGYIRPTRAISLPGAQYNGAYVPPVVPIAPQPALAQPQYVAQTNMAEDYMARNQRSSYQSTAREVSEAYERGRAVEAERAQRQRLDDLKREEAERLRNIEDMRRIERATSISSNVSPFSGGPGYRSYRRPSERDRYD